MSCPECFQGAVRTDAKPTGQTTKLHDLDCYVASPPDGQKAKGIIVIVPDAFGWELVNNRLLADEYARQGQFQVYLPDFMNGGYASQGIETKLITVGTACPVWVIDQMDSMLQDYSLTGWLTKPYHVASAAYGFAPFIYRNRLAVSMPRVTSFLSGLRRDDATKGLPIGVAGFCWGGQHVVRLCWETPEPGPNTNPPLNQLIDAAFTAHPSALQIPADMEKVRKPLCIAAGDKDKFTPIADMLKAKAILAKNGVQHEVEIYEGAGHGWSVRIDRTNPKQREQAEACETQAVRWFTDRFASMAKS